MTASKDLIDFDVIETQKENIQSLPGGRSARALAQIFSAGNEKIGSPSPHETKCLNDAIRQEYKIELQAIGESDDPLDIYDRYVKWTLNAYPSTQATPESGLLPLLERATKSFLTSTHYRNDPRYLRLWLHYIRLFSDAPRETFAFLARHHVGEGLALFYEEFATWLETAERWTQAEEVYRLGLKREARPVERLLRKFNEFQTRFEQRPGRNEGPSSPALPTVRPALATKVDPFVSARNSPPDPQTQGARSGIGEGANYRPNKSKLAVFTDSDAAADSQPPVSGQTKGWESITSFRDQRKENTLEAKPWAGETLKVEKKKTGTVQKMTIFRDESTASPEYQSNFQKEIPEHHVREAVNPRTGRRERVFVNLEAVYPHHHDPTYGMSFEELRAISRGWMDKDWRSQRRTLKEVSGNTACRQLSSVNEKESASDGLLAAVVDKSLTLWDSNSHQMETTVNQTENCDGKTSKARKIKVREVKGETLIIKTNLDSPTGPKIKRKRSSEPTMTFHTRAATDEIYSIFNQPLKTETVSVDNAESVYGSDYEDDDYTSAGESTGTGRVSVISSEFEDDETSTLKKTHRDVDEHIDDQTQAESVGAGEWTEFSPSKHVPSLASKIKNSPPRSMSPVDQADGVDGHLNIDILSEAHTSRHRTSSEWFVPQMPDDYDPPSGLYRDAATLAQNRLPFMTPITEKTESSLPTMTAARNRIYGAKTPTGPSHHKSYTPPGLPAISDLLLSSPIKGIHTPQNKYLPRPQGESSPSPVSNKHPNTKPCQHKVVRQGPYIIKDAQCNPMDGAIRKTILRSIDPPLSSYIGYHEFSKERSNHAAEIQKFVRALKKRPRSSDSESFNPPILCLSGADRTYAIKRQLGAGAFAPVYLVESVSNVDTHSSPNINSDAISKNNEHSLSCDSDSHSSPIASRQILEAIKMEVESPSAWEFYMVRAAHDRLQSEPALARATDSIINAHEFHLFKDEAFLVEDYRGQGTLLDLVNIVRADTLTCAGSNETGMDEALVMFFAVELFRTIEALHACEILHGDVKPDNCLVRFDTPTSPSILSVEPSLIDFEDKETITDPREVNYSPRGLFDWRKKGITLIDFGRGVDLRAFQPTVQFIADWETGNHECNEIREMRPWTYHIDLYGVAGTIHVMLFGKYIESVQLGSEPENFISQGLNGGPGAGNTRRYRIRESLKRYWDREIWSDVFDLLLNPGADRWVQMELEQGSNQASQTTGAVLPVLQSMKYVREKMESWLVSNAEKKGLSSQIRKLEIHLSKRKEKLEREK
ncbi:hypothetical protein V8E54_013698 [Elaphomyces granulatus]